MKLIVKIKYLLHLQDICRRSIIANQKVLEIVRESSIVELTPSTSNMSCVLPYHLSVVPNARTALIASAKNAKLEYVLLIKIVILTSDFVRKLF